MLVSISEGSPARGTLLDMMGHFGLSECFSRLSVVIGKVQRLKIANLVGIRYM